nr:hypothetical protein [Mesorhizobium sp.]
MIASPLEHSRGLTAVKPGLRSYGAPVGILMIERIQSPGVRPFIPGDVGNASTWGVPVRYKTVSGLNVPRLFGPNARELEPVIISAAKELVQEGAQLITCNCGYSVKFQNVLRGALNVPVFLSSLLLAPFLVRMLPHEKSLGIILASSSSLSNDMLEAAGLPEDIGPNVVVAGLDEAPAFNAAWVTAKGDLDVGAVEAEVVEAAVKLVDERPDVGMILLECGDLPPYAASVQKATGLPVFDYTSLINFFIGGLTRRPFVGIT